MALSEFTVSTGERLECVDVTDRVSESVVDGISGTATVFSQHTTCGITVNEAEGRLLGDVEDFLADVVPDTGWAHDEIDDNADSHLRATLIGPDVTIPVVDGELQLGNWQSVLLVECDGPRTRTVTVTTD